MPLTLADYDTTGRETDVLALIDPASDATLYAVSPRGSAGTLVAGDLAYDGNTVPITRIRIEQSGAVFFFNDNTDAESAATFFGTGGAGHDLRLTVQTETDMLQQPVAGNVDRSGGNFVWFSVPTDKRAFINGLANGTRFILVLDRPSSSPPTPPTPTPSTEARLSDLTVSAGALSPAFDSDQFTYEVNVGNDVTEVQIGASPVDAQATIGGDVEILVHADRPLVHLIAPIGGIDYAVNSGAISSVTVTTAGVVGAAARLTINGTNAVISSLRLRGHIIASGDSEDDTDDPSIALYGRVSPASQQYARYLTQATAAALVRDVLAYSAAPRGSWEILLDGDRDTDTMNAATLSEIHDHIRSWVDPRFDKHGELVRIDHQISRASGRLVTRLTMLDTGVVAEFDRLLLESGDFALLESGDHIRLEG